MPTALEGPALHGPQNSVVLGAHIFKTKNTMINNTQTCPSGSFENTGKHNHSEQTPSGTQLYLHQETLSPKHH